MKGFEGVPPETVGNLCVHWTFLKEYFSLTATLFTVIFDMPLFLVEIVTRVDSPVQGGENSARSQNTTLRQTKVV